jgi:peptidoglycan/LPS O-acetylase OafA/YrhL
MTNDAAPSEQFAELTKLDLVRSVAVLLVVISHLPVSQTISNLVFGLNRLSVQPIGLVGVGIFFVHTSLVLMMSLNRLASQSGRLKIAISFLIRRGFRIYPLSVATVLVLVVVSFFASETRPSTYSVVANILLIQNITRDQSIPGALWSLPFEVQMYLLLPGIFFLIRRFQSRAVVLISTLWVVSVIAVFVLYLAGLNYNIIKYFPAFIPGILAYTLVPYASAGSKFPVIFLILYIIGVSIVFPFLVANGCRENVLIWPVCLILGLLIPFSENLGAGYLSAASFVLARYSYGIYLIHGPMIELSFGRLATFHPVAQWAIFVCGVSIISYLAFHVLESPGILLGKRIANSIQLRSNSRGAAVP